MRRILFISACIIFISGCATTQEFREVPMNNPHARLIFREFKGPDEPLGPHRASPLEINGAKPSFWKWTHETFLVPEGKMIIFTTAYLKNTDLTAYDFVEFETKCGEIYYIDAEEGIKDVIFTVKKSDGTVIFKKETSKTPAPRNNSSAYVPIIIPAN